MDRFAVRAALLALLLAAPALARPPHAGAAAPARTAASIVGGTAAGEPGSLAYVTSQATATTASACSGTVVAPGLVLTAAHCLVDEQSGAPRPAEGVTVLTGSADRSAPGGETLSARRLLVHPAYERRSLTADLALIVLANATGAPPLALAGPGDDALAAGGARATIAGWGVASGADTVAPPQLLRAATTILSDDACRLRLGAGFDAAGTLCAADEAARTAATCRGDSGGPLLVAGRDGAPVEVGIVSWGSQACDPRIPQGFTRVSAYADWIAAQIAATPAPPPLPPPSAAPPPARSRARRRASRSRRAARSRPGRSHAARSRRAAHRRPGRAHGGRRRTARA